ncbi:hypothetical protein [Armatimonas sp.]|uniref:hypothetical protein n=1 Tax=Armatimonas sp. TaxID=1872638 RepID=UPI0037523A42
MNAQLRRMIAEPDRNKRAQLAALVQADIENLSKKYLSLVERQERIVRALLAAGLTHIPDTDEVLSLEGIGDKL